MWVGRILPGIVVLVFGSFAPLHAANQFTINNSDGQGVSGGLLATPPGTCTGVPGGLPGHCEFRASAAVIDWATGHFGSGTRWSDATDPSVQIPTPATDFNGDGFPDPQTTIIRLDGSTTAITSADLIDNVNTKIGSSWIPEVCNRPWCGNLLRGDVIAFLDENGDGVWNDTWIDDGDGIRETGEVDRTRAEQFAWGITSVMRNLSDVSLVVGNVSPPGTTRMRVRIALGDASQDANAGCDGDMANPACHNAVVTPPDLIGATATMTDDDAAVFGRCDPDRPEFISLAATNPVLGQRALDNCLWFFASFPVTAPSPGSFDALHNQLDPRLRPEGLYPLTDPSAGRDTWMNEVTVKYTASNLAEQTFAQNWWQSSGFVSPPGAPDINQALYVNDWRMTQTDEGTHTYPYSFLVQHTTEGRRRGFTQDPTVLVSECAPLLPGVTCDGLTNDTVDPFWGKAIVRTAFDLNGDGILDPDLNPDGSFKLNFDQAFDWFEGQPCDEACRESGVGHKEDFTFIYEQQIENGFLLSCLNCGHPAPVAGETVTYSFTWPGLPTVVSIPHPPPPTTEVPVLP